MGKSHNHQESQQLLFHFITNANRVIPSQLFTVNWSYPFLHCYVQIIRSSSDHPFIFFGELMHMVGFWVILAWGYLCSFSGMPFGCLNNITFTCFKTTHINFYILQFLTLNLILILNCFSLQPQNLTYCKSFPEPGLKLLVTFAR